MIKKISVWVFCYILVMAGFIILESTVGIMKQILGGTLMVVAGVIIGMMD